MDLEVLCRDSLTPHLSKEIHLNNDNYDAFLNDAKEYMRLHHIYMRNDYAHADFFTQKKITSIQQSLLKKARWYDKQVYSVMNNIEEAVQSAKSASEYEAVLYDSMRMERLLNYVEVGEVLKDKNDKIISTCTKNIRSSLHHRADTSSHSEIILKGAMKVGSVSLQVLGLLGYVLAQGTYVLAKATYSSIHYIASQQRTQKLRLPSYETSSSSVSSFLRASVLAASVICGTYLLYGVVSSSPDTTTPVHILPKKKILSTPQKRSPQKTIPYSSVTSLRSQMQLPRVDTIILKKIIPKQKSLSKKEQRQLKRKLRRQQRKQKNYTSS